MGRRRRRKNAKEKESKVYKKEEGRRQTDKEGFKNTTRGQKKKIHKNMKCLH